MAADIDERERATYASELSALAMAWMDTQWDQAERLLIAPPDYAEDGPHHMVRETAWYAVGLLARGTDQDRLRALDALDRVLSYQLIEPGAVYHGTWLRVPREPRPGPGAVEWRDYDPNWREFIGCSLLTILQRFASAPTPALLARIEQALREAASGSLARAVEPEYSNIAVQSAYLLSEAGHRYSSPRLLNTGEELARAVAELWKQTETFAEFNSPTYDGVTLHGLALWRQAASSTLRELGGPMEHGLWRQIAARYHPELCNIAGPYDRAYGMDMRRYISLVGQWIALITGLSRAPIPQAGPAGSDHQRDWCVAPFYALLGADLPTEVTQLFAGAGDPSPHPRHVDTLISASPRRTATSWLEANLMIGAEDAGGHTLYDREQYCPFVVHWLAPGSPHEVNWLRTAPGSVVDAKVDQAGAAHLEHRRPGAPAALRFIVHAPSAARDAHIAVDRWQLPGLTASVRADRAVTVSSQAIESILYITYETDHDEPLHVELDFTARSTGEEFHRINLG